MSKHREIVTLALAKRETVTRLVSQVISDSRMSDSEFQIILNEYSQYNEMKEKVWAKLTENQSVGKLPDVEKIKEKLALKPKSRFKKSCKTLSRLRVKI